MSNTPDELEKLLDNLYFAGVEADSIEVIGGGNNRRVVIERTKQAILNNYISKAEVRAAVGDSEYHTQLPPDAKVTDVVKAAQHKGTSDIRNALREEILEALGLSEKETFNPTEISACHVCFQMTHTHPNGNCTKCGERKETE